MFVRESTDARIDRKESIMNEQAANQELVDSPEPATLDDDAAEVYCWRMEQLLRAGYSLAVADVLATDTSVDLHAACDLLADGCAEPIAYMILR
jgi:hypothetical protein